MDRRAETKRRTASIAHFTQTYWLQAVCVEVAHPEVVKLKSPPDR